MKKNIFLILFIFLSFFVGNGHALTDEDYQLVKTFHNHFKNDKKTDSPLNFSPAFHALSPDKQSMVLTEKLKNEDGGSILLTEIMTNIYQNKITKECANIVTPEAIEASLRSITSITVCHTAVLEEFLNRLDAKVKDDLILNVKNSSGKNWWEQVDDAMRNDVKEIKYEEKLIGGYTDKIISFDPNKTDRVFEQQLLFLDHLSKNVETDALVLGTQEERSKENYKLAPHNPLVYAVLVYRNAEDPKKNEHQLKKNNAIQSLLSSLSSDEVRAEALQLNLDKSLYELRSLKNNLLQAPLILYAIQKQSSEFVAAMVNSITSQKLRDELILKNLTRKILSQVRVKNSPEKEIYKQVVYNYSPLSFCATQYLTQLKTLLDALSEDAREQGCKNDVIDFIERTQEYGVDGALISDSQKKYDDSLNQIQALFYIGSRWNAEYRSLQNSLRVMLSYNVMSIYGFPIDYLWDRVGKCFNHDQRNYKAKSNPCLEEQRTSSHAEEKYCKTNPCPLQIHKNEKYCKSKPCPHQVHLDKKNTCKKMSCNFCRKKCDYCINEAPPATDCELCQEEKPVTTCEFCNFQGSSSDESLCKEMISSFEFVLVFLEKLSQETRDTKIEDKKMLLRAGLIYRKYLNKKLLTQTLTLLSADVKNKLLEELFVAPWNDFLRESYLPEEKFKFCLEMVELIEDKDLRSDLMIKNQVLSYPANNGWSYLLQSSLGLLSDSKKAEAITAVGNESKNALHWAAGYAFKNAGKAYLPNACFNLLVKEISDEVLLEKALEQKDDSGQTPLEIYPEAQKLFSKKFGLEGKITRLKESLEALGKKLRSLMSGLGQLSDNLKK